MSSESSMKIARKYLFARIRFFRGRNVDNYTTTNISCPVPFSSEQTVTCSSVFWVLIVPEVIWQIFLELDSLLHKSKHNVKIFWNSYSPAILSAKFWLFTVLKKLKKIIKVPLSLGRSSVNTYFKKCSSATSNFKHW